MSSYLDRYTAGDHEAVWTELRLLGPVADDDSVGADIVAVARETMSRVRSDVEMISARLSDIGYRFGFAWDPESTLPGNTDPVVGAPRSNLQPTWTELRSHGIHLPASLRAFYEVVGSVNLAGIYVPPEELDALVEGESWARYFGAADGAPDPLYVAGLADALDTFRTGDREESPGSMQRRPLGSPELAAHRWFVCPDHLHLYGFSGADCRTVDVSSPAADADIGIMAGGGIPFVEHLRDHVLRRGGFRWKDDEDEDVDGSLPIAFRDRLVADLVPF